MSVGGAMFMGIVGGRAAMGGAGDLDLDGGVFSLVLLAAVEAADEEPGNDDHDDGDHRPTGENKGDLMYPLNFFLGGLHNEGSGLRDRLGVAHLGRGGGLRAAGRLEQLTRLGLN